jgi:hypothetical protein
VTLTPDGPDSGGQVTEPALRRPADRAQELADAMGLLQRMAKRAVRIDLVVIPPPPPSAPEVARLDQVGDDRLGGPFGDADLVGDVATAYGGIVGDAHHDVAVIGEERPAWLVPILGTDIGCGHPTKRSWLRE